MGGKFQIPGKIETAILGANPSTSRRDFLKSSGALVVVHETPGVNDFVKP